MAEAGSSSAQVGVEFPVYTESLPKDYEFFQRFTDGRYAGLV